ncbi:MAG: DUF1826 domain-containing protein [Alphaproteobacteria bacterium]|nr:MAG: DUF1826 domain-containing protein [Alphaproteobacteria bacterium]
MDRLSDDTYPSSLLAASSGYKEQSIYVSHPDELIGINNKGTNLVVWVRDVKPALKKWLDQELWCALPGEPFRLTVQSVRQVLADRVAQHCPTNSPGRRMFIDDLIMLTRRFAAIAGMAQMTARLVPITGSLDSRFHVDSVAQRLLTTYVGHGTEWIDGDFLGDTPPDHQSDMPAADANSLITQLPQFSVALFKGSRHGAATRPLVHRSPATPGPTGKRLLFCLDGGR